MNIEAVILTGGSSRRMGSDKASLIAGGKTLLERTLYELRDYPTTVLGPGGSPDPSPGAGPLAALAAFTPSAEAVFVAACDMPRFDGRIVAVFGQLAASEDAIVPVVQGRLQPLCGLYRRSAIAIARELDAAREKRIMTWLHGLRVRQVSEEELIEAGISPLAVLGANTLEDLEILLKDERTLRSQSP